MAQFRPEDAMSIRNMLRYGVAAMALLTTLSLGGAQAALADVTYYLSAREGFRMPHWTAPLQRLRDSATPPTNETLAPQSSRVACEVSVSRPRSSSGHPTPRTRRPPGRSCISTISGLGEFGAATRIGKPMRGYGWKFAYTYHAPASRGTQYANRARPGQGETWEGTGDDEGLTCRSILNGLGSVCSNF
jgi:hypothetical protein